jgi:hypothetical protein
MSVELFEMALNRFPDYKNYPMHTNVKLKIGNESTSIVGYMDIEHGGVLLKKSLTNGKNSSHFWYTSDLDIIAS